MILVALALLLLASAAAAEERARVDLFDAQSRGEGSALQTATE